MVPRGALRVAIHANAVLEEKPVSEVAADFDVWWALQPGNNQSAKIFYGQ